MGMCSLDIKLQGSPREEGTTQVYPENRAFGKPDTEPCDDDSGVAFAAAADATTWHRRLGHITASGAWACCARKRPTERPSRTPPRHLATLAPWARADSSRTRRRPHARRQCPCNWCTPTTWDRLLHARKGGFSYVAKFTDGLSRMKEVYLLKAKSETTQALHAYNMNVAGPLGRRIEIVRCDRGGAKTSGTSSPRTALTQGSPSSTPRPTLLSETACPNETDRPWRRSHAASCRTETSHRRCGEKLC